MYVVEYAESVRADLASLRAFERTHILDRIEQQLIHQPTMQTRRKKIVFGLVPPWQHEHPVWQLRVGQYRVFYDVNDAARRVTVRAIRYKPPHKTTEEIL